MNNIQSRKDLGDYTKSEAHKRTVFILKVSILALLGTMALSFAMQGDQNALLNGFIH